MNEKTIRSRTVFRGRLLRVEVVDVETSRGVRAVREIVRHRGAAVVLAELPDGRFLFVRQFRKPLEEPVLEAVAGLLDEGEAPAACARRETREETGYEAQAIRRLGVIYASPGYADERLHVFHARLKPEPSGGEPDEDEHLELVPMAAAEIERRIAAGRIRDAKTLAAWALLRAGGPGRRAAP